MKKHLFLLMLFMGMINLTYASFPVTEKAVDQTEVSLEIPQPIVQKDFNWQAFASAGCALLAFSVSWLFSIPGMVFGVMAITGNKNLKWLGWIELIGNFIWFLVGLAYVSTI